MDKSKTEAIAKAKKMKRIFMVVIIFVILLLAAYGILIYIKKRKQDKIISSENNGEFVGNAPSSSNSSPQGEGFYLATKENVTAIQNALNRDYSAGLTVDGLMGPETRNSIIQNYGPSAYPLSTDSLSKIITGKKSGIGFVPSKGGDEWPLIVGSSGDRVKSLKVILNKINKSANLDVSSPFFDNATYDATLVGPIRYYPVDAETFIALNTMSKKYA